MLALVIIIYVVVHFYPWFNFNFSLFQTLYHTHYHTQITKENKIQTKENSIDHLIYVHDSGCKESQIYSLPLGQAVL